MDTNNSLDNFFNINIDNEAKQYLKTASTWARIVAIVGLTGSGFSVIQMIITASRIGLMYASWTVIMTSIIVVISVIVNIILIRFANRMSASLANMNQGEFDEGINSLRSYFKVVGILLIISISLCIVGFIFYVMILMNAL